MSNYEFPSDFELNAIEQQTAAEVAADNATLRETDEHVEFNFCENCPLLGFPKEEVAEIKDILGWSARYTGTVVAMALISRDGVSSKEMLLGTHNRNSIGGRRVNKIYNEAAKRTQECDGPRRIPSFLGPISVKKCKAIKEFKR